MTILNAHKQLLPVSSTRCGLRGGYVELVNVDPAVMKYTYKLFSKDSCAPVLGQIALDLMTNPPQPGDPSYPLYDQVRAEKSGSVMAFCLGREESDKNLFPRLLQEINQIRSVLCENVKRACEVLNSLPGFVCQPVEGGAFAFPRLFLPPKASQRAKVTNV